MAARGPASEDDGLPGPIFEISWDDAALACSWRAVALGRTFGSMLARGLEWGSLFVMDVTTG
jgi:hypothetical protein